ncbi:MAG: DEAD/DEAH box helicase [Nitrososphaerales archaeon]
MRNADLAIINNFKKAGYEKLTPIQEKALPVLSRHINALLVAPTGSGKTESAVIPIFTTLASQKGSGIRAIYVTPLRALNRDVLRRIIKYAETVGLKVEVRHGDTSRSTKKKMTIDPPDILITTPETLAIVLTNEKMINIMKNLQWVVVDEVHELISNERGTHLALSLERLQFLATKEIIRIGLSATIGNLDTAAKFLAGTDRKCAVLIDNEVREYDIEVKFVKGSLNDVGTFIAEYVMKNYPSNAVLLFTNTRDEAEYLSTVMKNYKSTMKVDVHHGSLSKDMRQETEERLRSGTAGIVVCTSSLELGLDIGSVELVTHCGSPRQVSKLMQRIGRSRHKLRQSAKGLLVTNNPDEELEAIAITRRMRRTSVEEQVMHELSLDVLAHHLVGLTLQQKSVDVDEAYKIVSKAYPFRQITVYDIESCLDILHNSRIINYDRDKLTFRRKIKAYKYYFENISTIPDVLKFEVVDSVSKKIIGTLDQRFVGDYGERGNVFVLKGSQWRVLAVDDSRLRLSVEPIRGAAINIPYWVGEMIPVAYETAVEVGKVRCKVLNRNTSVGSTTVQDFHKELRNIPDHRTIVIESGRQKNMIVIHACFGTKANNTLAALLSTILSSKIGYLVESRSDAYRIILSTTSRITKRHIMECFSDEYDLEAVIVVSLRNTHNVNWRVWQVAKRFGLIDKQAVYDRRVARLIYDRYSKTAISKETIRELMHDKYDISLTTSILERLKKKEINVIWNDVEKFSDLSRPILEHSGRFSATPLSVEQGVIALVKERLQKTRHKLICIRCGNWERVMETKNIPDNLHCTKCRSRLITTTFVSDQELASLIRTKLKGGKLTADDDHKFDRAWKAASLIHNFGRKALLVLSGYGVGVDTAARLLRNSLDDSEIFKQIYEAERQYIVTRGFWDN